MTASIPCKRPQVTAEPDPATGLFKHVCHVPGCGWTFVSVKSAQEPGWHRRDHRDAVPATAIDRAADGHRWAASCSGCLRVETRGTRTDAQAWLDHHLSALHGLVIC